MTKSKNFTTKEKSPTPEDSYNSENDGTEVDKKMLSSILARVAALEKENKDLKNEANRKERAKKATRSNNMESKSIIANTKDKVT